jgi:hypothetical protein
VYNSRKLYNQSTGCLGTVESIYFSKNFYFYDLKLLNSYRILRFSVVCELDTSV